MKGLKTILLAGAATLLMGFHGELKANSCCLDNIKVGAEYLYWEPCDADLDYAVVAENDTIFNASELHTKHLCCDWDSGYRVYAMMDKIWCDFGFGACYTSYTTDSHKSVSLEQFRGLTLSTAIPNSSSETVGDFASAKWKLHYRTADLIFTHPLNLSCDPCWHFDTFSGIKWVHLKQKKDNFVASRFDEGNNGATAFNQHVHTSGVGPTFGMCSAYTFCDSLKLFGMMSGSVIIADSKNKDHYIGYDDDRDVIAEQTYKEHNDCACFYGMHLKTGVSYNTCYCNMQMGFHIGWEYIHWINAPGFTYYESFEYGVRSSNEEKTICLQGLFVGADISF